MSDNDGNTFAGVLKAFLASPVGGWALAVIAVAAMAYVTFKDRQTMYQDLMHLREAAMPLLKENNAMLKDVLARLKDHQ